MKIAAAKAALRKAALAAPGAWEDHPWGETVFKVGKKIFCTVGGNEGELRCTFKLPDSGEAALTMFSFCEPTGYGLGKSGWVSSAFDKGADVPLPMLVEWLEESYGAIAPKKLLKAAAPQAPAAKKRRAPAKR